MGYHTSRKYHHFEYTRECDLCGRQHHVGTCYEYHFETMDGGDYMSDDYCWLCEFKSRIYTIKEHIKKFGRRIKNTVSWTLETKKWSRIPKYWRLVKEWR